MSDNSVRKWLTYYNLPYKKEDINAFFNKTKLVRKKRIFLTSEQIKEIKETKKKKHK